LLSGAEAPNGDYDFTPGISATLNDRSHTVAVVRQAHQPSGAEAPKHQPIFHDSFLHSAFRSAVLLLKHDFYVM
jgi:hypothetical protein